MQLFERKIEIVLKISKSLIIIWSLWLFTQQTKNKEDLNNFLTFKDLFCTVRLSIHLQIRKKSIDWLAPCKIFIVFLYFEVL